MSLLAVLLMPVFLALGSQGELRIYPEGLTHIHDLTKSEESPVFFSCSAIDLTPQEAQLKWFDNNDREISVTKGRIFIQIEEDSIDLRIAVPNENNTGFYTCKGVIDGVEKQARKELKIFRGIQVLSDKRQSVVDGTDDKVMCETAHSSVSKRVTWFTITNSSWSRIRSNDKYKAFSPKPGSNEPAYLLIRNVSAEDELTYICNIDIRTMGKSHAHHIELLVTVPPTFINELVATPSHPTEGDRLELTCSASGKPPPTYTFRKYADDTMQEWEDVLVNSTSGYHAFYVNRTEEGIYECEAMNAGGKKNSTVTVDVKVGAVIEKADNVTEEENQNVRMACVASGDPAPSLSWRNKQTNEVYGANPTEKFYIEEDTENLEFDEVERVYHRTLYLNIPSVQPRHAGFYVCQAENSVGHAQQDFYVNVTYKPTFSDMEDSPFFGWVGSNTNLTCVVSGNPKPKITWVREGQVIDSEFYTIVDGDSSQPQQTISYLTPRVDETNQATMFGTYTCEAENIHGKNIFDLVYELAVIPEETEAAVVQTYPTAFSLQLQRPLKEGGQPVTKFVLTYAKVDDEENVKTLEVPLASGEPSVVSEVRGLTPKTEYVINVTAVNNVGPGALSNITATTDDYSKPAKVEITSKQEGTEESVYTLKWNIPMTGGAQITKYMIEYAEVEKMNTTSDTWEPVKVSLKTKSMYADDERTTELDIPKLKRDTYYQVKIRAKNRIGWSDWSTIIIKTSKGVEQSSTAMKMQTTSVALLTIATATAYLRSRF